MHFFKFIYKKSYRIVSCFVNIQNTQKFKQWVCVCSIMNSTDYANNLFLKYMTEEQLLFPKPEYHDKGTKSALYKLSNVSDSKDFLAFIIIPISLAILRETHSTCSTQFTPLSITHDSQKFSAVNLYDIGSMDMNIGTDFIFSFGSK